MLQHDVKISNDVICNNRIELKKKKGKRNDQVYFLYFFLSDHAFYSILLTCIFFGNFYI